MATETFPSPPITEAVIEIRVENPPDEKLRGRISASLEDWYPEEREQMARGVAIDIDKATAEFKDDGRIFRRMNAEGDEIAVVGQQGILVSQLATYPGWQHLFSRFERDWAKWKSLAGYRKIVQIGLRYINRIDVPLVDNIARHEDYLNLQVSLPPQYENNIGYSLSVKLPLHDIRCVANVNSGTMMPALVPGHAAFLLDIDVVRAVDLPQKDADISELLLEMRHEKNRLFNAFVTDAARETFRNEQPLR